VTTLGARIRSLRQSRAMSQSRLAEGLVTKSMISQIESDRVHPSRELLAALAAKLGVTPDELLPARSIDQERTARYRRAQALLALGHAEEALPLLLECLDDPHPKWPLRELTRQTADCLRELGRVREAREMYERALRLAVREDDRREAGKIRCQLGELAEQSGELRIARQEWRMALQDLGEGLPAEAERRLVVKAQLGLARVEQDLGQPLVALRWYEAAIESLRGCRGMGKQRAAAYAGLGQLLGQLGRLSEAEQHLHRAQKLYEQGRERGVALEVRAQRALLIGLAGRREEAEAEFEVCLRESREILNSHWIGQVLYWQAQFLQSFGELDAALRKLREAIQHFSPDDRRSGRLYMQLAAGLLETGDVEGAREVAQEAITRLEQSGGERELLDACQLLARICKQGGDYQAASMWNTKVNELLRRQLNGISSLRRRS
jgi:tetratricopeptide (TPR) repeat protein